MRILKCVFYVIYFVYVLFILQFNNLVVYTDTTVKKRVHGLAVQNFFRKRKNWTFSNLGTILFYNADPRIYRGLRKKSRFLVLVQPSMKRFSNNYSGKNGYFTNCSVKNCQFSTRTKDMSYADAVLFNVHENPECVPKRTRNSRQVWILFSEESPVHTFGNPTRVFPYPNVTNFAGRFNWTMTYRSDSDIPVPYGRTIPLAQSLDVELSNSMTALEELVPYWHRKQFKVLAMSMISNCNHRRVSYLYQLRKYMEIHFEGTCFNESRSSPDRCSNYDRPEVNPDCKKTEEFIFYLAFENSSCKQYVTEKCFHNSYFKGAIPVIMGPPLKDCERLLPPRSFLHVDNYDSPKSLISHMRKIAQDMEMILTFHAWRKHFSVVMEHGYYNTRAPHLCRVCEALNYNNVNAKVYHKKDLDSFFDKNLLCDTKYNEDAKYKMQNKTKKRT